MGFKCNAALPSFETNKKVCNCNANKKVPQQAKILATKRGHSKQNPCNKTVPQQAKKRQTLVCKKWAPRLLLNGLFQKWAPEPLASAQFVFTIEKLKKKKAGKSQPVKETTQPCSWVVQQALLIWCQRESVTKPFLSVSHGFCNAYCFTVEETCPF